MKMQIGVLYLIIAMLLGWANLALAHEFSPTIEPSPAIHILVVDGTKTFSSTIRVAGIISLLRQMGSFEVAVHLADMETDFEDPLAGEIPQQNQGPFDLILILPRGLDTKMDVSIWLVSDGLYSLSPCVRVAVGLVSNVVDQFFTSASQTIDVSEDLWPGFLWAAYLSKGWIR